MLLLFWHILTALLTFLLFREAGSGMKPGYGKALLVVNLTFTVIISLALILNAFPGSDHDTPEGIAAGMNLNLVAVAFLLPRTLLTILHYAGRMMRIRRGGYMKSLTLTGLILYAIILSMTLHGHFIQRFRFAIEEVAIELPGLKGDLDGLKIVHISDLHLGSFHGRHDKLSRMARLVNDLDPDLIIDTGDFITLGHREFGTTDTILVNMTARYGKYAVLGNHDIGTYLKEANAESIDETIRNVSEMIRRSGYILLESATDIIRIGDASLALTGAETRGRHPGIIHPDIGPALAGSDDADLRILLTHDPNHWDEVIRKYPGIEITLAGHTHAMQFGFAVGGLKWSPSAWSYPRWNGLYREGDMYLYVNRGAGVLGIPARIGMRPEVTLITLKKV